MTKIFTAVITTNAAIDASASFLTRREALEHLRTFARSALDGPELVDEMELHYDLAGGKDPINVYWGDNDHPEENWEIVETEMPVCAVLTRDEANAIKHLAHLGYDYQQVRTLIINTLKYKYGLDEPDSTIQSGLAKLREASAQ